MKPTRLIRENYPILRRLGKLSVREQRQILKHAPDSVIDSLSEGALNVLKGGVTLSPQQYKRLKRQKAKLKTLANRRASRQRKRRVLLQRGGFLPLLASVIVPAISSIIASRL